MCGSAEIKGYTFCSGLKSLELSYKACPDLQSVIYSVTYLIREAIFRPKYTTSGSSRVSLNIRPLGELIDMYHTHEATKRHDKVYALLGMSSDELGSDGLSIASLEPNYKVPWKELLQRLVNFLLCKQTSVATWNDRELAVIKSKGCILGKVSLVDNDATWHDRVNVDISFKNRPSHSERERKWNARWTLQALAKSVKRGDLVCLLQGTSKPTIIRPGNDHFTIITLAVAPMEEKRMKSVGSKWLDLVRSIDIFPWDFLLVWDWEQPSLQLQDLNDYGVSKISNCYVLDQSKAKLEDRSEKATRLGNVSLILENSELYIEAGKRLLEAVETDEKVFGNAHLHALERMDKIAMKYKKAKQWKEAEELFLQILSIKRRMQGVDHPDTLNSLTNLTSTYGDQGHLHGMEKLEVMRNLLKQNKDIAPVKEEEVVQIAGEFRREVMSLLLERRGDEIQITEEVVKAAAGNPRNSETLMNLLLDRRAGEVKITEEVLKAAAGNPGTFWYSNKIWSSGKEVMELLLDRRADEVRITDDVVKAAAGNPGSGRKVMELLLDRRADEVKITEEVVMVAAGNPDSVWHSGKEVMELLLDRRAGEVKITEEVLKAAARNPDGVWHSGKEVMELLLRRRADEVKITEEVVTAAAGNSRSSEKLMKLLLDQRSDEVKITEEVLKAVAGNPSSGGGLTKMLLDRRADEVKVTEEVLKAAARNRDSVWYNGKEVIELLLHRRADEVKITEQVLKTAAANPYSGKVVMALLLDRRADEVKITEGVLKAAAGNLGSSKQSGKEVMALLLDRRADEVKITEEVVKAAAGNQYSGREVMGLLFDRRADEVKITEEVLKAAEGNLGSSEQSSREVMSLLLHWQADEVKIREELVKGAAGNAVSVEYRTEHMHDRRKNENFVLGEGASAM